MTILRKSGKLIALAGVVGMTAFTACNNAGGQVMEEKAIVLSDLDTTADPRQDFNQFANGGWMANNPLPDDKSRFGSFQQLADKAQEQVRELIDEIIANEHQAGSEAQMVKEFYNSGMDTAAINAAGIAPVQAEFDKIEALATIEDVKNQVAEMHLMGFGPLYGLGASADANNSSMNVAYLWQSGLGLPGRDYYLENDERSTSIREKYVAHMANMFVLMGHDEAQAQQKATTIMAMETEMAKNNMSKEDVREPEKWNNKKTVEQIQEIAPNIDWNAYLAKIGVKDAGEIIVGQPEYMAYVSSMFDTYSVEEFKAYLSWKLLSGIGSYLSEDFVNERFNFYGRTLTGQPEMRPRWKRVLSATSGALDMAIGKVYVEKYFPAEAKERMVKLVGNLRLAMKDRIDALAWMGEETKAKAHEKLETMNLKVGFPDEWKSFEGIQISKQAYVLNVLAANRFHTREDLNKINTPVDKKEWHMSPQTVNAYYSPTANEIVFPAAILQPPFFYMDADDAVNYGAIGVVIGHEMTHGFDDKGRKFDKDGNLNLWWTKDDETRFNDRSKVLVNQFNTYTIIDTLKANGTYTLGENIADLGGLNISYLAFMKAMESQEAYEISGFTHIQRFFLAYAHVWAQNIRDEEAVRLTKVDVHSLGRLRVFGPLRNMPEFHAAFNVQEGDAMYLPESERAMIW